MTQICIQNKEKSEHTLKFPLALYYTQHNAIERSLSIQLHFIRLYSTSDDAYAIYHIYYKSFKCNIQAGCVIHESDVVCNPFLNEIDSFMYVLIYLFHIKNNEWQWVYLDQELVSFFNVERRLKAIM